MEPDKKLKLAKIFGIIAALLLAIMLIMLEVVILLSKKDGDPAVFVTFTTILVFLWLFLTAVVLGLSIAGIALSSSARKAGEPYAGRVLALCIITLVTVCIGFVAYTIVYGVLVGA